MACELTDEQAKIIKIFNRKLGDIEELQDPLVTVVWKHLGVELHKDLSTPIYVYLGGGPRNMDSSFTVDFDFREKPYKIIVENYHHEKKVIFVDDVDVFINTYKNFDKMFTVDKTKTITEYAVKVFERLAVVDTPIVMKIEKIQK